MRTLLLLAFLELLSAAPMRADVPAPPAAGDRSGGVGLALDVKGGMIGVAKVMPKSPAAANKQIREGHRILAVGEGEKPAQSLVGKELEEAVSMIRGEVGSQVRLTVIPENGPITMAREVLLTRDDLANPLGLALDAPLLEAGAAAPDLRYVRLGDGKLTSLVEHRGHIVVLQFWATWCAPCQQAATELQKIAEKLAGRREKVLFLTINIDGETDAAKKNEVLEKISAHVKHKVWTQTTHGWSSLDGRSNWHIRALPATYVIGTDGMIKAVDPEKIEEFVTRFSEE